jgi:prepilin-type N-terminal cleavage/methylation domain-containing protein
MRNTRFGENGFTVVELVITVVVIGIVAGGLSSLFLTIQRIQVQTAYLDSATRAAQREVESLRNENYATLTPGQTITFTSLLPASLPKNRSGTVAVTEPVPGLRRVDVLVTYSDGSGTHKVNLSSLIGVIGIAQ